MLLGNGTSYVPPTAATATGTSATTIRTAPRYMLRDLYLGALYRWCQQQGANAAIDSLAEDLQASLRVLVRGIETQPRSLS
ncbi:hypothetical protein [Streptomyces noursei]|uniref:Uncharacterized protein n=1 Tax=Streptomyces noursei TaxID=1971 RepID=A0A401QPT4_STRNR|nr:hypothetical protein [Streptomyces noursei]UWS76827.1 hypothetical protein N1H47_39625 [Streptomyces noursei]GCB87411.1 hypothetical protein SALB_00062 [Streptomyces noursei]